MDNASHASLVFGYIWQIVESSLLTMELSVLSLIFSTIVGIALCTTFFSNNTLIRYTGTVYSMVSKGFPELLLIFIIFYGGQILLNVITERFQLPFLEINPFWAGVLCITIIFSSYMAETFKGAFLNIPQGQIEAAQAFGLSKRHILLRIITPQIIKYALPGYTNNWLVLLKTTAIVSVIGLNDMLRKATIASGVTHNPMFFYGFVAVMYLIFTYVSSKAFQKIQEKYFSF